MISFYSSDVYIVTGASSGIGEGVALLLNELGASVVAIARSEERLNAMKQKCKHPENMHLEIKDLAEDIDSLPTYVKTLKEKYGKFSGMAYCAGVTDISPLQMIEMKRMQEIYNINVFSPIFMAKGVADKRNNIGKGTSMVFISGLIVEQCTRGMLAYGGAKSALCCSVKTIAKELAPYCIRANCVLPSDIKTAMTMQDDIKDFVMSRVADYPMGMGEVVDVANMVVFLLSDKAKWITGQDYIVDCASF